MLRTSKTHTNSPFSPNQASRIDAGQRSSLLRKLRWTAAPVLAGALMLQARPAHANIVADIAEGISDAVTWTEGAVNDAGEWFEGAAVDAVDWTVGAVETMGDAAQLVGSVFQATFDTRSHRVDTSAWGVQALRLQNQLDARAPLRNALFVGTHNSYNALEYSNMTRYIDPNQKLGIYEQLEAGMTALELDVHWFTKDNSTFPWDWEREPILCHGRADHHGCSSTDRSLLEGLVELQRWLRVNPNDVVFLFIEEYLDGHYDEAIAMLEQTIGPRVYRPSGGGCQALPLDLTKQEILNSGKQVIVHSRHSTCSGTDAWKSWMFGQSGWTLGDVEEAQQGQCPVPSSSEFVRYYEDHTHLSDLASAERPPITEESIQNLLACRVNLLGLDNVDHYSSDRIAGAVWSWHDGEPNNAGGNEDCAVSHPSGRFNDIHCSTVRRFACRSDDGDWYITTASGPWSEGMAACESETTGTYQFAAPTSYLDNEELKLAKEDANITAPWIFYSDLAREGRWVANDLGLVARKATRQKHDSHALPMGTMPFPLDVNLPQVVSQYGRDPAIVRQVGDHAFLQEDHTVDNEVAHVKEHVDILSFPMQSSADFLETGQALADSDWKTVQLSRDFVDPVVFVRVSHLIDPVMVTVRLRNITSSSFQVRTTRFEESPLPPQPELLGYVVVEAGEHRLGEDWIEVGRVQTSTHFDGTPNYQTHQVPFSDYAVVAQIQSANSPEALATRIREKKPNSFKVRAMGTEEEEQRGRTVEATIGYMVVGR